MKLRQMRKERKMSQKELAEKLSVSQSTLSLWELGKYDPDIETIKKIASIFEVSVDQLLGIGFYPDEEWQTEKQEQAEDPFSVALAGLKEKTRLIPIFESVSAGFGAYAQDEVVGYTPLLIESASEAEQTICIRVQGDSMSPVIENGDMIQVYKTPSVDSGSVGVFLIEEEAVVKKVQYVQGEDWLEFHSFNENYPILRFENENLEKVKVLGLVRRVIKDFAPPKAQDTDDELQELLGKTTEAQKSQLLQYLRSITTK